MISRPLSSILLIIAAFFMAGCNSDVFVNDDLLSSSEVTIAGDGGAASIRFQPRMLEQINFETYSSGDPHTYYNAAGKVIYRDSPASEVARISYDSPFLTYNVYIEGREIRIESTQSTLDLQAHARLRLTYSYKVEFIDITIEPGKPFEVVSCDYFWDEAAVKPRYKVSTTTESFVNGSPLSQILELRPFLNEVGKIEVKPAASWAKALRLTLPLPVCNGGEWELGPEKEIVLGHETSYTSGNFDRLAILPVPVPPQTKVKAECLVYHSCIGVRLALLLRAPVTGDLTLLEATCTATEPTEYELVVTEI